MFQKSSPNQTSRFPVWAPPLVMAAVILTGLVLALSSHAIPTSYFVLFAVATIACAFFVDPRGLFLTVAAIPVYYVVGTFIVGWFATSGSGATPGRKARILTAAYPTVEHFLWLLVSFLIALAIAMFRWWFYREELARRAAREAFARRRRVASERTNRESYTRARTRSIEELREASERRRRNPAHTHDADWNEDSFESVESRRDSSLARYGERDRGKLASGKEGQHPWNDGQATGNASPASKVERHNLPRL
ncbi:DUF6542 domain-containing protein [Corynebacterium auriscanis]|uniref:DUF6542 domain-containing protein n=1 Tax=Corynebacterium auriscanis TaxID=99807 RepID=UPI0024AD9FA5|nr:DUF6542 domain-containing protein [Corynebacterium auriscanis]